MIAPARNRDLSLIRESGSTARVLNLALIHERMGTDAEYIDKPVFQNRRLNRALIVKHALRPEDRDAFAHPPRSATKIIVPFATGELRLGGMSMFVDQVEFDRGLHEAMSYQDAGAFEADTQLLRLLDSLPSFDPFLMRERMRQSGYTPARCYFDISEADIDRMRAFVGQEISELVGLAFANGGPAARILSEKLAQKLLTDEAAQALDPLRETLRLNPTEYREGIFAWKGFLYYKWMTSDFADQVERLKRAILSLRIVRATTEEKSELALLRRRVVDQIDRSMKAVSESIIEYGCAFAALSEGQPEKFRDFLIGAPARFIPIGEAVGVAKHIESFWRFRFPEGARLTMDGDEALGLFEEFDATLESAEFARSAEAPTTQELA